jgi:uroporphyrin-III C-methyltransferase/precorrin-2 dehydrogenase/sirohydrochlorin ferrochelatase
MDYFPLFADLRNRPCLIVGAGQVAARKLKLLRQAGARVTLVAPEATDEIQAAAQRGEIRWLRARFRTKHLTSHVLVISATNSSAVNQAVADAAAQAGRLCNVVDDPARCSFITPAIVDRGGITVAISSGGRSPTVARWVKAQIEKALPQNVDQLVHLASRWRESVTRHFKSGTPRQRLWLEVFNGPIARLVLAGRAREADRAMTRRLAQAESVTARDSAQAGVGWLVGAGPGEVDLLSLRGARLLGEADVVMHDALVAPSVLELARRDATFINVGKRAGHHSWNQDDITRELVRRVAAGARVCRLKGGDPFTFGRGGEEALALSNAGLSFEIVPGVTAAAACGAYAGIPLTHRGVADSVTFVTAHGCQPGHVPDYRDLADKRRTVVFYMGVRRLRDIARGLMHHGRAPDTPVAIVQHGARSEQRVRVLPLSELAAIDSGSILSPASVIVGDVVRLRHKLTWFGENTGTVPTPSPTYALAT